MLRRVPCIVALICIGMLLSFVSLGWDSKPNIPPVVEVVAAPRPSPSTEAPPQQQQINSVVCSEGGGESLPGPTVLRTTRDVDWGSSVAPPLCNAADEWCAAELQRVSFVDVPPSDAECELDKVRQGKFSTFRDIVRYSQFPWHNATAVLHTTDADRRLYWRTCAHPLNRRCNICTESLSHSPLYSLRRWWKVRVWYIVDTLAKEKKKSAANVLGLLEDRLEAYRADTSGPQNNPTATSIENITDVHRVVFCFDMAGTDGFVVIKMNNEIQLIQFVLPVPGLRCFWRSLQILLPSMAESALLATSTTCGDVHAAAKEFAEDQNYPPNDSLRKMPRDESFPYLPCYEFGLTAKMFEVDAAKGYDQYRNTWPTKCNRLRVVSPRCAAAPAVIADRNAKDPSIKVAVVFTGFLRSFANTRREIFSKIVEPHNATVFGVTWNIIGRAKKTQAVTKKDAVPVWKMLTAVKQLMGFGANDDVKGRVEVLNYFEHARQLEVVKLSGFYHPGLFFIQSRGVQLVNESGMKFDVVIRTRFDVFPSVPLVFSRAGSDVFAINLGSSCEMQGAWFPQRALVEKRKVLRHYADTRYKLFAWQVCDWIDVGQQDAMMELGDMYNWVVGNNVWSAAQYMEHAFFIDRHIAYQPVNFYMKILRRRKHFFG